MELLALSSQHFRWIILRKYLIKVPQKPFFWIFQKVLTFDSAWVGPGLQGQRLCLLRTGSTMRVWEFNKFVNGPGKVNLQPFICPANRMFKSVQHVNLGFFNQVTNYGQLWLCGPTLPASFRTQTSKNRKIQAGRWQHNWTLLLSLQTWPHWGSGKTEKNHNPNLTTLQVKFKSNHNVTRLGFRAVITAVPPQ